MSRLAPRLAAADARRSGGRDGRSSQRRRLDRCLRRLIAFGGHFGGSAGRHFGSGRGLFGRGRGFFGRGRGFFGGRRGRSHGFLHSIARALAFAYILHLLFSHGALSLLVWLAIIGLVVLFIRSRRRRRRVAY